MLRLPPPLRRMPSPRDPLPADAALAQGSPLAEAAGPPAAPARGRRLRLREAMLALMALIVAAAAIAYPQRSRFTAQGADLSRRLIGDENTARLESVYFRVEDRVHRLKYRLFGEDDDAFAARVRVEYIPQPPGPVYVVHIGGAPAFDARVISWNLLHPKESGFLPPVPRLVFPQTYPMRDNPEPGEYVWSTAGLPRNTPEAPLLARTFVKPDRSRPYATVGVLLVDARRTRLVFTGGTVDPGGFRGVAGPGAIPQKDLPHLLVAFNGGFKGPHGNFGMVADGKTYVPLRNGLASIAVLADGTIRMGEWGRTLTWDDAMVAVRQNAVLLVENGEVSRRVGEGNDTWGYVNVNSAEFITWRSAVGLTKEGNLLIAAGNSLSAETLAKALRAAGAHTAMQLDINTPYVLTSLFSHQPDGSIRASKFMDSMPDNPARFLKSNERDFAYLVVDETRLYR